MTFRRITKSTKLTFPCVVAYREASSPVGWISWTAHIVLDVTPDCTHWLPFEWPGSGR